VTFRPIIYGLDGLPPPTLSDAAREWNGIVDRLEQLSEVDALLAGLAEARRRLLARSSSFRAPGVRP
jgi:hypothetical protein